MMVKLLEVEERLQSKFVGQSDMGSDSAKKRVSEMADELVGTSTRGINLPDLT